ncbi:MAG: CBS domain-containing protein [Myxococcaceae bacterium]|nr:CBS domain-containing protein [Myxococcaceae bacterium]
MTSIEAVMSTALLTVRDTELVSAAAAKMEAAGIRHLPVTDAKNHVVGIISNRDTAAAGRRTKKRVGEVMSREVKVVRPTDAAEKAVELMVENKIGSVPVVDDEETLVGIVTETDFLQVAWQALKRGNRAP